MLTESPFGFKLLPDRGSLQLRQQENDAIPAITTREEEAFWDRPSCFCGTLMSRTYMVCPVHHVPLQAPDEPTRPPKSCRGSCLTLSLSLAPSSDRFEIGLEIPLHAKYTCCPLCIKSWSMERLEKRPRRCASSRQAVRFPSRPS